MRILPWPVYSHMPPLKFKEHSTEKNWTCIYFSLLRFEIIM